MSRTLDRQLRTLEYYRKHAEKYCGSTSGLDLSGLHRDFLKRLPPGAHILDAGCGSGRDTKAFLTLGYRVTAFDACPQLAALATTLTGQHCRVLAFQHMEFREEFDGIWACASLLHLPRREMLRLMPRFIRALKVGGMFYVSLKEGEGQRAARDGRFFCYYTIRSFRRLLSAFPALREVASWRNEEIRPCLHAGPWLSFLLEKVREE